MNFDGYSLRTQSLDDVFAEVEKTLGVRLDESSAAYGAQEKTVGFRTSSDTWVRIAWRLVDDVHGESWTGEEIASAILGVRKPELLRSYRWTDRGRSVVWRADEAEYVSAKAIHHTGVIHSDPELPAQWWDGLKESLAALAVVETQRVSVAQGHLTRRVNQVFGDHGIDTEIEEWTTAHADLHFGNLTAPDLYVLDWESWGRAPRGLDAATLWGHCLTVTSVADRVQAEYADDLNSRSGLLAQLMFCANVMRLNTGKPSPSPLLEPAKREADRVVSALHSQ